MSYFDELVTMLESVVPSITDLPGFILEVLPVVIAIIFSIVILFVIGYSISKIKGAFQ